MHNITLICTKHSEIGKCNSNELLNLIEKNNPTVIFEELSPITYKECYEHGRETLESTAIKIYLKDNVAKHIPVVGTEISDEVNKKFEINKTHSGCNRLLVKLHALEYKYGFDYLNSKYVNQLFDVLARLEQDIVAFTKDEAITDIYNRANKNIDIYENDIIENVYNYSASNKYDNALMFIGAAHRESMIEKIENYNEKQDIKLNWTFYDRGHLLPS